MAREVGQQQELQQERSRRRQQQLAGMGRYLQASVHAAVGREVESCQGGFDQESVALGSGVERTAAVEGSAAAASGRFKRAREADLEGGVDGVRERSVGEASDAGPGASSSGRGEHRALPVPLVEMRQLQHLPAGQGLWRRNALDGRSRSTAPHLGSWLVVGGWR